MHERLASSTCPAGNGAVPVYRRSLLSLPPSRFCPWALSPVKTSERIAYDSFATCGDLTSKGAKRRRIRSRGRPCSPKRCNVQRGGHGSLLMLAACAILTLQVRAASSACLWRPYSILLVQYSNIRRNLDGIPLHRRQWAIAENSSR